MNQSTKNKQKQQHNWLIGFVTTISWLTGLESVEVNIPMTRRPERRREKEKVCNSLLDKILILL
jgi:hypothetical protein